MGILYRTYLLPMREVVSYYVHDNDAIWDILHDGFILAFSSMDSLKKLNKLESWLTSIMKNLALQYIRKQTNRLAVPLSDMEIENECHDNIHKQGLSWDELHRIIGMLPEGYGNVFRLAVLDGLSHKEIGALLGIAPHSSSSQLSHAKAMLRRMIMKYRVEMGMLSIIGIILLICHGIFKQRENATSTPIISKNTDKETPLVTDSIVVRDSTADSISPSLNMIHKVIRNPEQSDKIAEMAISGDSVQTIKNDSIANDSIRIFPNIMKREKLIVQDSYPLPQPEKPDWSLSLAYAGSLERNDMNRYRIPNPTLPDVEGPDGEIEVTEKNRHYMPMVIGLSINKSLSSRWSVESGLRYTLLRSDFLTESKFSHKGIIQHIHYIGIPLKTNCRFATYNGFSLYGHAGVALDIPVYGHQSILEYSPTWGNPERSVVRINAPLQWSVEGGIGLQYHLSPSFSIYAEPSFKYFFNPGSDIKTIRQEKPFDFTIPIGLRLTW
ncbi:MAG: sigma-70 family RNA polymerase sigma factor [Muribaculaceae bacterium]|nr:sigma-70 family RNA polymerase sigma factor [Muribaculaceae bacterium]